MRKSPIKVSANKPCSCGSRLKLIYENWRGTGQRVTKYKHKPGVPCPTKVEEEKNSKSILNLLKIKKKAAKAIHTGNGDYHDQIEFN